MSIIVGGIVGWYCRALQFVVFVLSAGVRRLVATTAAPDLEPLVREWETVIPGAAARTPVPSRCAVTLHHWYQAFRPADVNICLAEITALGAGHVRADIRWKDLLPERDRLDSHAIAWYRCYLRAARDWYGLKPIVVLSNPPRSIARLDRRGRVDAWERYIDLVIANFGDLCQSFQLMNELNNPVFRFLHKSDVPKAIASAAERIRARLPGAEIIVNVLADLWEWKESLQKYIDELGSTVDIFGIDCYPETWGVSFRNAWTALESSIADLKAANPNVRFGILETGYSTNISHVRDEEQQTLFYRRLEAALTRIERTAPLSLIAFYEICDENSRVFLDPEAHFGLLRSKTFTRKACFPDAQRICRTFRSE